DGRTVGPSTIALSGLARAIDDRAQASGDFVLFCVHGLDVDAHFGGNFLRSEAFAEVELDELPISLAELVQNDRGQTSLLGLCDHLESGGGLGGEAIALRHRVEPLVATDAAEVIVGRVAGEQ